MLFRSYGSGSFYSSKVVSDTKVEYYRYWLVNYRGCDYVSTRFKSIGGWQVSPEAFNKWLFIDDGGRQTLNADGVVTREEVFKEWGLDGSKGVH